MKNVEHDLQTEMDRMIEKADDEVAKYVKEMLEDDEVLYKAKFL